MKNEGDDGLLTFCEFHWKVGESVQVNIHGLLSLVYHVEEGLKHVVEIQGLVARERHYVPGKAVLDIEEKRPPLE